MQKLLCKTQWVERELETIRRCGWENCPEEPKTLKLCCSLKKRDQNMFIRSEKALRVQRNLQCRASKMADRWFPSSSLPNKQKLSLWKEKVNYCWTKVESKIFRSGWLVETSLIIHFEIINKQQNLRRVLSYRYTSAKKLVNPESSFFLWENSQRDWCSVK